MFEAASVGIPVVAMNAPAYRRDVHHGLRFWDAVPGPQVDDTDQLLATIHGVLDDPRTALTFAPPALTAAYVARDGHAATRAASAVQAWLTATRPGGSS